jgi:hypothetical protein
MNKVNAICNQLIGWKKYILILIIFKEIEEKLLEETYMFVIPRN